MMFSYIWEYIVKKHSHNEFERIYGPEGDWVRLFRKGQGYLGTELHRDHVNPYRYITVDYWASKQARDTFRAQFTEDFERLDEQCESLTEREVHIGDFVCFQKGVV